MKKLSKLGFLLAAGLSLALAAGCSNISSEDSSVDGGESETRGILATVEADSELADFSKPNRADRSIVPEAFKLNSENPELKFYLAYQKTTDTEWTIVTTPVSITPDTESENKKSTSSGTFLITLPRANYNLRLYGVGTDKSVESPIAIGSLNTNAALVGTTTADLRRGDTVSFTLKADPEILTGTNLASLVLYAVGDWNKADNYSDKTAYTVTAELQDVLTGKPKGGDAKTVTLTEEANATKPDATANYTNQQEVTAGTYNLVVKFTKGSATYEYSDTIIIVPGKKTKGVVAIPKVVATEPKAPENFKAAYIAPKSAESGYYDVEFQWDDKSENEAFFEMQLADLTSVAATSLTLPTSDSDATNGWAANVENQENAKITRYGIVNSDVAPAATTTSSANGKYSDITAFYGTSNDLYVSGSLNKNNETVTMKLPLGGRYAARIRSVNAAGTSAWAYVTIGSDIADKATTASHKQTLTAAEAFDHTVSEANTTTTTATPAKFINLYRLTYELKANAKFSSAGTGTTPSVIPAADSEKLKIKNNQIVSYYNESADGIAILNPNGYNTAKDVTGASAETDGDSDGSKDDLQLLQGTSYYWIYWESDIKADGTKATDGKYADYNVNPENYKGFKNLTLTAVYGSKAGVTIQDYNKYNLTRSCIKATVGAKNTEFSDTVTSVDVDTADENITWTVTYPEGVTYERVEIKATPTKSGSTPVATGLITASGETWKEDVSSLQEGTYEVKFTAYHSSNAKAYYSETIYMIVSDKGTATTEAGTNP